MIRRDTDRPYKVIFKYFSGGEIKKFDKVRRQAEIYVALYISNIETT